MHRMGQPDEIARVVALPRPGRLGLHHRAGLGRQRRNRHVIGGPPRSRRRPSTPARRRRQPARRTRRTRCPTLPSCSAAAWPSAPTTSRSSSMTASCPTPRSTTPPPARPALLREKGVEPGDRVGIMLPNVAVLRGLLLRRAARRRGRRADERPAQGARGRLPPGRLRGEAPPGVARVRRRRAGRRRAGGRRVRARRARRVRGAARAPPSRRSRSPSARRRHGADPLHLGHDRHAEGRRAHARQPAAQRRGDRGPLRARPAAR